MIERLRTLIRRRYVKYLIWAKYRKFNDTFGNENLKLNYNERICKSICHKLINQVDSKFLIAPISGQRYIKNSRLGLFIILDDRRVSITNHVYHYDVILNERDWDRLSGMYDNKTEKIRQEFEDEMISQIKNSLSSILQRIGDNN
jgi:hypothetical protein